MHSSYMFNNYICKTHFIVNEENKDEIVKVHFSNESQYADEFGNHKVDERYTKTQKHFAKSYDDALDIVKKQYHDKSEKTKQTVQNHKDFGHIVETEDVKSFDVIPLNRPEQLDAKQKVRLN